MSLQSTKKATILALDDEQLNLELLRFILERHGYQFFGTNEPQHFFDSLTQGQPDLILLDVIMPNTDGFDLCAQLKKNHEVADIPVIFLTGKVNIKDKVRGFEVGGVDYVTKPFNEQELLARIQTHVALVRAKREIEIQAENLLQSNRLKDRLFSIIGHDLRSPLSAAKLKMDFVSRGIIDPKSEEFVSNTVYEMQHTLDEALSLLQNLLSWARSESGRLKIIPECLDMYDLVEQTFRLLRLGSDHKNITLTNSVKPQTLALGDLNTVKTILRNLVSNAIKFTPNEGQIRISVTDTQDSFRFFVADNGLGISAQEMEKILAHDLHFTKPGTQNEAGTGLGLKLCQSFVELNGGSFEIESELGSGSTFSFDLPKYQEVLV